MKKQLIKWVKYMLILGGLFIGYILTDFSFNQAKPKTYQFKVPPLLLNTPIILKQDNMMVIVARFSQDFLKSMEPDGNSRKTLPPVKKQQQPIDKDGYFAVLGYGSHLGCPLVIAPSHLKESCSNATYSLNGKTQNEAHYDSLNKVDYRFSQNHTILTIN